MDNNTSQAMELDFEIVEMSEATAMEEMGASSTIAASSTCSVNERDIT